MKKGSRFVYLLPFLISPPFKGKLWQRNYWIRKTGGEYMVFMEMFVPLE